MGIIQKQTIKGTIYSYLGVIIGFLTAGIIFPQILSTQEIGLLKLLVSFSVIFSQLGSLGFASVINRLFPYFRDKESGHQGFLIIAIIVSLIGFALATLSLEILKPFIIRNNIKNSELFVEYFNFLTPLIFFTLFFNLFDTYIKAIYDAVIGTILKELVQRLLILCFILLYFFNFIPIRTFIILYVVALCIPTVIIMGILILKNEFKIKRPGMIFNNSMKKEMIYLSFHGILAGLGATVLLQVDSILVNKYLGLAQTGIYATAFFFGTIILIPSRPLSKIASTILADSWKSGDMDNIQMIYKKSCLTQAIISILLFVLLWVNINNVFHIIPSEYITGKWVIFIIGLTNVIEMSTGINSMIIQTSKSYRINTLFIAIFLVMLVVSNIILIPIFGLPGAALSALISNSTANLLRFVFLKKKYKMQPFNYKILLVIGFGGLSYLAGFLIPTFGNFIVDIGVRSSFTALIFIFLVLRFKISEDINIEVNRILRTNLF